jgi:hypothetical protein
MVAAHDGLMGDGDLQKSGRGTEKAKRFMTLCFVFCHLSMTMDSLFVLRIFLVVNVEDEEASAKPIVTYMNIQSTRSYCLLSS